MKRLTKNFLFLSILWSNLTFTQEPEKFHYDFGFIIKNAPPSGNINFSNLRYGIIFSGDNKVSDYFLPQKKIYAHFYTRYLESPGCPTLATQDIIGTQQNISWNPSDGPHTVNFDYIGRGVPRLTNYWLGYGLYKINIKCNNTPAEQEYEFYIDFQNSRWLAADGPGTDIKIWYDYSKPINQRVKIEGDYVEFNVELGKVFRAWNELQAIPVNRENLLYIRGNVPIADLNEDILLSSAIVDANTTILPYRDPTTGITVDTENLHSKIIIDPYYYPEPSKLKDLKLTIADNVTLTAQRRSALIVGDGAEISLGNNSMININPFGNLFIDAYSNWSFGTNSQLIVNGNFMVLSKIPSGWSMLSVPNNVTSYIKTVVWRNAVTAASTFENGGYVAKSTLENGKGYWVKFNQIQNKNYEGAPILNSEINVVTGWNMIGSVSLNLLASKITSNPPGIMITQFYGYSNGSYKICDTLRPGNGYWVKVNQNGKLFLNVNSTSSSPPPPQCSEQPSANPPEAPSVPILVSPLNGAIGISNYPTFRWRTSQGATIYLLQISTNNCFTNLVFDDPTITDTLKQVGLSYSTIYYWRVNASNNIATSNWSNIRSFTTKSAPISDPCDPIAYSTSLDKLTITDASGNSQEMFIRNAGRAINLGMSDFDLPPSPPKGMYNVRFQSDKFVETVLPNQKIKKMPIVVKNAKYPININWDIKGQNNISYWLTKPGGQKALLSGNGNLSLTNSTNDVIFIEAQAAIPGPCNIFKVSESEDNIAQTPVEYILKQNFPNPFNPKTQINYALPEPSHVIFKVYDVLGCEIATLVDEFKEAGYYEVGFDASKLTSGVYFYRLQSGNFNSVRKMLLLH